MKKSHLLIAASALVLASCAEEIAPVNNNTQVAAGEVPMSFNFRTGNMTRTEEQLESVCGDFGVWAYKGNNAAALGADGNCIMTNYLVGHSSKWPIAAGIGEHSDWWYEHLGNTQYPTSTSVNPEQFLKYWDLGKDYTVFFAYAPYIGGTETPTFTLNGANGPRLAFQQTISMNSENPYMFAGRIEANAHHASTDKVPLLFNRFTSQIRLGIYEAIEGYHVEMIDAANVDGFDIITIPVVDNGETAKPRYTRGSLVFSGKPYVDFDLSTFAESHITGASTYGYTDAERHGQEPRAFLAFENPKTNLIKRVAADAEAKYISQTNGAGASMSATVYNVIPNNDDDVAIENLTENGTATTNKTNDGIQVVFNFRLVSDDTGEVITVKNARATVPAANTQWEANTLYTYIFKITKNTSGTTTNPDPDPEPEDPKPALYPIVFDDVQIEAIDPATGGAEGNDHEVR